MEDEYELVPLSPIRKVERRMEKIEKTSGSGEVIKELIDVVRTNQQIVDDIVKINSDMMTRVSTLSSSVQQMTEKINEFMDRLEVVGGGSSDSPTPEANDEVSKKLDKLEKRINSLVLSSASHRRPKRMPAQAPF